MSMTVVWLKIDEGRLVQALQEAVEKLDNVEDEVVLDFGTVRRLDPAALKGVEEFVGIADSKGVKVVLRGVSISVYKVFKLLKLGSRFSFEN